MKYENVNLCQENDMFVLRADSERFDKQEIIFQGALEEELDAFLRDNRLVVDFVNENSVTDLYKVNGKEKIGYWRMYYRSGRWYGRWFETDKAMTESEIYGLDNIILYIQNRWKSGCNYEMEADLENHYSANWGEHRYLLRPRGSDLYLVMVDTTFGNGDYPVRIYVYRNMEKSEG